MAMGKANARQSSKNKVHYDNIQPTRTRKNKEKRILQSSGAKALTEWNRARIAEAKSGGKN